MTTAQTIALREVSGTPSTPRTAFLKQRYLEAPLMVDIEYIRLLTESHRRPTGWRSSSAAPKTTPMRSKT